MGRLLRWCAAILSIGVITVGSVTGWAWLAMEHPKLDRPRSADAVVVLSGDLGDRMREALRLMKADIAPTLVHAGIPDTQAVRDMCAGEERPFEVVCLHPEPDSTRGEARAVGRLVRDRRWNHVIIVTSKLHTSRARLLFGRCTDADLDLDGTASVAYDKHHEWLGLVYAITVARGC
jgi:uncharacterized SAM-binding protein YcdF (DUF218 family)